MKDRSFDFNFETRNYSEEECSHGIEANFIMPRADHKKLLEWLNSKGENKLLEPKNHEGQVIFLNEYNINGYRAFVNSSEDAQYQFVKLVQKAPGWDIDRWGCTTFEPAQAYK